MYNRANLLAELHCWLRIGQEPAGLLDPATASLHAISSTIHDEQGRPTRIRFGNGATTDWTFDRLSSHLVRLVTRRDPAAFPADCPTPPPAAWPGCHLQNLRYTIDPAGNVTHIRDDAQQTVYFRNQRIDASSRHTYDATYRLVEATGREHLGQAGVAVPYSASDAPRVGLLHPNDGNALARYAERYAYDAVGNLTEVRHRGTDAANPGWVLGYQYAEPSLLEPARTGNRLTATAVGGTQHVYSQAGDGYDEHGNLLRMPHLPTVRWDARDQLRMTSRGVPAADGSIGDRTWNVHDFAGQRVRKVTERSDGSAKAERLYLGAVDLSTRFGPQPIVHESVHLTYGDIRIAIVETRIEGSEPGVPAQLIRFQHGNHVSSAVLELDEQARVISYEEFSPYGATVYQAVRNQLETRKRYRYGGRERDDETGLVQFGARYYAPWIGRWISPDPEPLRPSSGRPSSGERRGAGSQSAADLPRQSDEAEHDDDAHAAPEDTVMGIVQLYVFARGNPIRYQDSAGEHPVDKFARAAAKKAADRFFREWGTKQAARLMRQGGEIAAKRLAKFGIVPDVAKHIADHFKEIPGKVVHSLFNKELRKTEKLSGLITETLTKSGRSAVLSRADNGALVWIFEKDFGKAIGRQGEQNLTKLRVIVDLEGRLVTAFPVDKFVETVAVGALRVSAKLGAAFVLMETLYEGEANAAADSRRRFDEWNNKTEWWEWLLPWDTSRLGYEPNFHTIRERQQQVIEKLEKESGTKFDDEEKRQISRDVEQIWLSVQ